MKRNIIASSPLNIFPPSFLIKNDANVSITYMSTAWIVYIGYSETYKLVFIFLAKDGVLKIGSANVHYGQKTDRMI